MFFHWQIFHVLLFTEESIWNFEKWRVLISKLNTSHLFDVWFFLCNVKGKKTNILFGDLTNSVWYCIMIQVKKNKLKHDLRHVLKHKVKVRMLTLYDDKQHSSICTLLILPNAGLAPRGYKVIKLFL